MTACASIACASCPDPGYCCRSLALRHGNRSIHQADYPTTEDVKVFVLSNKQPHVDGTERPLPFVPTEPDALGVWRFSCPKLGADGRCTIYDRRPWLCSIFVPGQDSFCKVTEQAEAARRGTCTVTFAGHTPQEISP